MAYLTGIYSSSDSSECKNLLKSSLICLITFFSMHSHSFKTFADNNSDLSWERNPSWLPDYCYTNLIHSVHPPSLSAGGGGGGEVEPLAKFSKRQGLTGSHFLQGGCLERGSDFFQGGGLQFLTNCNLKYLTTFK